MMTHVSEQMKHSYPYLTLAMQNGLDYGHVLLLSDSLRKQPKDWNIWELKARQKLICTWGLLDAIAAINEDQDLYNA